MKHLIYLHGFASSPGTKKGLYLKQAFPDVTVTIPDLNVPDFAHLTLTAMIEKAAETILSLPDGELVLIGSSMGGLVAVHTLDRKPEAAARVDKLVLLAPAFDFKSNREKQLSPEGLQAWKERGYLPVQHFADGKTHKLHYGLVEDIQQYDSYKVNLDLPTLIYHGRNDESVPHEQSIRFAQNRDNVTLHIVDSDHELIDQLEVIQAGIQACFKPSNN